MKRFTELCEEILDEAKDESLENMVISKDAEKKIEDFSVDSDDSFKDIRARIQTLVKKSKKDNLSTEEKQKIHKEIMNTCLSGMSNLGKKLLKSIMKKA